MKATKLILNAGGTLKIDVLIMSRIITRHMTQGASQDNIKRDFAQCLLRAINSAIFLHLQAGGDSNVKIFIQDYVIIYYEKFLDISVGSSENHVLKKSELHIEVRDKETKELLTQDNIIYEHDIQGYYLDNL